MRLSFFILFFLLCELVSLVKVGQWLGGGGLVGLLVLSLILGGVLFNFQGHRLRVAVLRGQPGGSPLDAISIYVAGFLFIFPGFFSDCLAVLLILPPTRVLLLAAVGQFLLNRLGPRMQRMQGFRIYDFTARNPYTDFPGADSARKPGDTAAGADDDIIEGEFRDVTDLRDRDPGCAVLPEETDSAKRED